MDDGMDEGPDDGRDDWLDVYVDGSVDRGSEDGRFDGELVLGEFVGVKSEGLGVRGLDRSISGRSVKLWRANEDGTR